MGHQTICDGAIAQLGERYNGIVEVSGSIPLSSTNRFSKTRQPAGFCFSRVLLFECQIIGCRSGGNKMAGDSIMQRRFTIGGAQQIG